jgi:hypothetical protein
MLTYPLVHYDELFAPTTAGVAASATMNAATLPTQATKESDLRRACQSANQDRHYDELFAPTTAGVCGLSNDERSNPSNPSDEGVGSANSLSECQ